MSSVTVWDCSPCQGWRLRRQRRRDDEQEECREADNIVLQRPSNTPTTLNPWKLSLPVWSSPKTSSVRGHQDFGGPDFLYIVKSILVLVNKNLSGSSCLLHLERPPPPNHPADSITTQSHGSGTSRPTTPTTPGPWALADQSCSRVQRAGRWFPGPPRTCHVNEEVTTN